MKWPAVLFLVLLLVLGDLGIGRGLGGLGLGLGLRLGLRLVGFLLDFLLVFLVSTPVSRSKWLRVLFTALLMFLSSALIMPTHCCADGDMPKLCNEASPMSSSWVDILPRRAKGNLKIIVILI